MLGLGKLQGQEDAVTDVCAVANVGATIFINP